jgi:general secretion pathway protein E
MKQPVQVTPALVREAHRLAKNLGHALLTELAELTTLSQQAALLELASLFSMTATEISQMRQWQPAVDRLPLTTALQKRCLLFRQEGVQIAVIADPLDLPLQLWLETLAAGPLEFRLASPGDIDAFLSSQESGARALDSIDANSPRAETQERFVEQLSLRTISEDSSPIVRIVNSTIYDALKSGASDIHIESGKSGIVVRYRIDGVLSGVSNVDGSEAAEQVLSRIKVMAELDIAERRVPQDGRFKISALGRDIDIRVSIMPSIHGEDAVLRILDKHTIVPAGSTLSLDLLGFDSASLLAVRLLAAQPYGMLLVTGPTGSGKTTTLYAAISEMNLGRDKIVTIEDPVEYELPGVLQIPVNEKKGLSFARGLRSILRHDPDKIMVGEIRDPETAEIAVQSALTGHLVLTTVHANNVFDVFNRFTHMGIDPYALTSALNGVWAQRLLRTVCPRCATPYQPTDIELAGLGLSADSVQEFNFRKGQGCGDCRGTGYRGRRAIAEILTLNDRLRELIANKASLLSIKAEAKAAGTRFLREAALDLVRTGETTLEEMARVTLH